MTIRQALYTAQSELRDDGFKPYYCGGVGFGGLANKV